MSKKRFATFEEAFHAVDSFMNFYNHRNIHHSLSKRSPAEFMQWIAAEIRLLSFVTHVGERSVKCSKVFH
ncbi:hypothetical protein [Paenibacillus herberti]|uniref:hypothetical protein n=1 Tax=Paenibacillus herberti TaxID=1619309 RepID=UPI003CCBFB91